MTDEQKMKLARECAEGIAEFTIQVRHVENYSGEHREWFEPMDIPEGNPFVIEAAIPAILAAINAPDPQLVEATGIAVQPVKNIFEPLSTEFRP